MTKKDRKGCRKRLLVVLLASILMANTLAAAGGAGDGLQGRTDTSSSFSSTDSLLVTEIYHREKIDMNFIAIYNPSSSPKSLSSFEVSDQEGAWIFPEDAEIGGDETLYLAHNGTRFEERMFFQPDWEVEDTLAVVPDLDMTGQMNLAMAGDEVIFKDDSGTVIDAAAFGDSDYDGVGWDGEPIPRESFGVILARNQDPEGDYVDNDTAEDWIHPSVKGVGYSDFGLRSFEGETKAEAFVSPDSSFQALKDLIDSAEDSIYMNGYELTNWYITESLIDALDRGVEVKLFFEGGPVTGIEDQQRYNMMRLAENGSDIRYMINEPEDDIYSRYRFNHAKYCVVDDASVVVTSENWKYTGIPVNNTYGNRGWGIIVHDESVASYYLDVFNHDYDPEKPDSYAYNETHPKYGVPPQNFTPDKDVRVGRYEPITDTVKVEDEMKIVPVIGPDTTLGEEKSILPTLEDADRTIDVIQLTCNLHWGEDASVTIDWDLDPETQYLRWDDGREHHNLYLKEAINAARNGVKVNVLLDSVYIDPEDDTTYDNYDVVEYLNTLAEKEDIPLKAKLADHEELGFEKFHTKGMIVDNETVLISSINWGAYAAVYNRESGILVSNEEIARYYSDVFYYDWRKGEEVQDDDGSDGDDGDDSGSNDSEEYENEFKNDTLDMPSVPAYPDLVVDAANAVIVGIAVLVGVALIWDKLKSEE